jgi:POT family proton-dependent oligopeptide transporter
MVNYLKFDDVKGNIIYGVYQSLIYAMPVMGGMVADKILGQRRSIIWGGILLAFGSFVMAIPVKESFFIGMGILVVGNGYFKPNISTIVAAYINQATPGGMVVFRCFTWVLISGRCWAGWYAAGWVSNTTGTWGLVWQACLWSLGCWSSFAGNTFSDR